MDSVYALPGLVALAEWFLAAMLYVVGWYRTKYSLNRAGDGLVLAGLVTTLAGVAWLGWDVSANLVLARSSLAAGLAVAMLAVYALLARRRTERLSALAILGLAIPIQAYAAGRLWWGGEVVPPATFMPLWLVFRVATGLVGYGGLAVAATAITLSFTLSRMPTYRSPLGIDPPQGRDKFSPAWVVAAMGLSALEWRSVQIALVALSVSLSAGLIRSWWGLGQVMADGITWALITWLFLAAGAYGLMQGAVARRLARALFLFACVIGAVAVLTISG